MKQLLKSFLVIAIVLVAATSATGAFFTSVVTAPDNQIIVGTLALGIDSTRIHTRDGVDTWGTVTDDGYTVAQDVNGVSTAYAPFEPWLNAAPGPYSAYTFPGGNGADSLVDGNKSIWVAFRNNGSIPLKFKASAVGGWVNVPRIASNPAQCGSLVPNPALVTVQNVTIYGTTGMTNICKGHEECENIYYGLQSLGAGWTYSTDADIQGGDVNVTGPITGTVYGTSTGTSAGNAISLNQNEFVIARVDLNFDTSDNCYQGAEYQYDLVGSAYQLPDGGW